MATTAWGKWSAQDRPARYDHASRADSIDWPPPLTGMPAVAVGAGRMYSAALLRDGSLVVWGENSHSQCGVQAELTPMDPAPADLLGLSAISAMPLRVPMPDGVRVAKFSLGEFHTMVLTTAGEVFAFGDNSFGATCNARAAAVARREEPEEAAAAQRRRQRRRRQQQDTRCRLALRVRLPRIGASESRLALPFE